MESGLLPTAHLAHHREYGPHWVPTGIFDSLNRLRHSVKSELRVGTLGNLYFKLCRFENSSIIWPLRWKPGHRCLNHQIIEVRLVP